LHEADDQVRIDVIRADLPISADLAPKGKSAKLMLFKNGSDIQIIE
jgi:hypothetical protein